MATFAPDLISEALHDALHPLSGSRTDYDPLIEQIGDALPIVGEVRG